MRKRQVLISGGAGFIGSHLCDYYIQRGYKVWCIDNLCTSSIENIKHLGNLSDFKFIQEDLITFKTSLLKHKFDMVFHLASPASPPDYFRLPLETLKVNSLGTEKMLEIAKMSEAKFLFSSTSEVYGDPTISPQPEIYWGNVNPVGPRSVYDEGKRYGEALVMAYHRKYRVNTRIIRIFNTYGERMRLNDGRVIPNFIAQILDSKPLTIYGDGKQTRSFCYVDDLIKGITKMIEVDYHLPVNLGNPDEFTILQLAEVIQKITGIKAQIEFLPPLEDDPKQRRPDISKAKELLHWEPKVSLEEGLTKTLNYFRSLVPPPQWNRKQKKGGCRNETGRIR
ncbi:MAG: SDR family oxidoreductase [Candidatus Omnitrophica bacterium]|nr:SDR family oxidoreductase [Candidatus Omnitrophota bacterium]MCM8777004.1 SDR family oxidoreductase [Candidatus Omnitrophota bacterium]